MRRSVLLLMVATTALATAQRPKIDGPISFAQAFELAERNSPLLVGARSDIESAKAGVRFTRSALSLQLSANSFATTGTYNSIVSSSPGVMPPYWMSVPSGGFLDQNLMAMFPLFTGGRLEAVVGSATQQQRIAEANLAEARGNVRLRVADAYLRSLVAREMTRVQEAKLIAALELRRTTQAQFEAGKGIEATVQRVQAEVARAQRFVTSAKNEEAKAELDLKAGMGVDSSSSIALADGLKFSDALDSVDSYLDLAKKFRGALVAARAMVESKGSDVRAAERQRSPQVYVQAMGDLASNRMGTGVTLGLTLSIPIFDGGRIRAEVDQNKALRGKAEAELSDMEISVETEVRQVWLDVETAKSNKESAESSVRAAQAAYDVVALRVSVGKAILLEQLDALQSLTEARGDLAQAIYEHELALAKLTRATGVSK